MTDDIDTLRQALEAALRDAERYRWLRAQCDQVTNLVQYMHKGWHVTVPCLGSNSMDKAIDTAMRQQ